VKRLIESIRNSWRITLLSLATLTIAACAGSEQSPADDARQGFEDFKASIEAVVSDPQRAAEATALVDEMERNFEEIAFEVDRRQAAYRKLAADYNTPRAELEAALAQVRQSVRDNQRKVSDTHRRLVDTLTAEEWDELDKQASKALEKAVAAARS
jgi:hypothetical protein